MPTWSTPTILCSPIGGECSFRHRRGGPTCGYRHEYPRHRSRWRTCVDVRDRRRSPHAHGAAVGLAEGLLRRPARWRGDQGRAGAGRGRARAGGVRDHGSGAHGGRRADPGAAGRGRGRHPDGRARAHDQQGVPVRDRRHRAGRPADPRGRVRDRRRGRPGVDDAGAAPARQVPRGLQVRRRHDDRPHGLRRPVLRVRPGRDGCVDGEVQRPLRAHPRGAGRVLGALAPAGRRGRREGHLRRRDRAGGDPAAQGRPRGVRRPTRESAATPPSRASASSARRSRPTARSRRARRRRSPTGPRPWS